MAVEVFKQGLELFADQWQAPGTITFYSSGDLDDYITISTTANRPLITGVGNYLVLGKDATSGHSLDADDVIFGEDVEIDGVLYADGGITAAGTLSFGSGLTVDGGSSVFNEASADYDFRVETANLAYAIYADGGKDSIVLGANTDVSATDHLVHIGRSARTATAATDYADLWVEPAGAVTIPTGTTNVVASAYFTEPNIIEVGSVTYACTVYIKDAPTEGDANYAIYVDAGQVRFDGGAAIVGDITSVVNMSLSGGITMSGSTENILFGNANDEYILGKAHDTDGINVEVCRWAGAADPYFSTGGSQQHKFYYSGVAELGGIVTVAATGSLTLSGGVVTATKSNHEIVVESGTGSGADSLDTINGAVDGAILFIHPATSGANDQVTVTDDGNIVLAGAADFVMDHVNDIMFLRYDTGLTKWVEASRSSNG